MKPPQFLGTCDFRQAHDMKVSVILLKCHVFLVKLSLMKPQKCFFTQLAQSPIRAITYTYVIYAYVYHMCVYVYVHTYIIRKKFMQT